MKTQRTLFLYVRAYSETSPASRGMLENVKNLKSHDKA